MAYLKDVQPETPYLLSRFLLTESPSATYISDDIGGIIFTPIGSPTLGRLTMVKGDQTNDIDTGTSTPMTSALGGYTTQANYFDGSVSAWSFTSGVTIEGVTALDPNGQNFYLFDAPGQAYLLVDGSEVQFGLYVPTAGGLKTLTSTSLLVGYPQLIHGVYDLTAGLMEIYVDGTLATSQAVTGAVATSTTGVTTLLQPTGTSTCAAVGQDIAVYNGALSANRITQHFQAFAQIWPDPAHVLQYPPIGVTQ